MNVDMQKSYQAALQQLRFSHLKFTNILCRVIFKLINCVPANYQEEPLSRGQRPVKIYVLSILNYILMYARPVCLTFSRMSLQHTYISYNYKVLSNPFFSLSSQCYGFFFSIKIGCLSMCNAIFHLRPILINISARSLHIQSPPEYQNWSMNTLGGLHMYNTVQNYLESHKESRKRCEMITFLRFENVECISILLFSF